MCLFFIFQCFPVTRLTFTKSSLIYNVCSRKNCSMPGTRRTYKAADPSALWKSTGWSRPGSTSLRMATSLSWEWSKKITQFKYCLNAMYINIHITYVYIYIAHTHIFIFILYIYTYEWYTAFRLPGKQCVGDHNLPQVCDTSCGSSPRWGMWQVLGLGTTFGTVRTFGTFKLICIHILYTFKNYMVKTWSLHGHSAWRFRHISTMVILCPSLGWPKFTTIQRWVVKTLTYCKSTEHISDLPLLPWTCPQYDGTIWNFNLRSIYSTTSLVTGIDLFGHREADIRCPPVARCVKWTDGSDGTGTVWCCWMLHRFLCFDPGEVPSCSSCWKLQARSSLLTDFIS